MPQAPHPLGEIAWDINDTIDAVEQQMAADGIDPVERHILCALRSNWKHLAIYHRRQVAADSFARLGLTKYTRAQFRSCGVQTTVIEETIEILA